MADVQVYVYGGWLVNLTVSNADKPLVQFGIEPGASPGFDIRFDLAAPPYAQGNGFVAFISATRTWPEELERDVRATLTDTKWLLAVEPAGPDKPVVLSWTSEVLPPETRLRLYQVATPDADGQALPGTTIDMATTTQWTVTGAARQYLVVTSAVEFVLALGQGWNLISLPVEPDDPTVAAAFRATAGRGMEARGEFADGTRGGLFSGEVWAWDGASGTYTAVSEVHALTGYWVHSTEGSAIVVRGMPPVSTELSLSPGWNLVGPPGEVALPAAPSIVSPIWFWNGTRYESAGHLYPGWGYWLFSTEPFQWLVGW